MRKPSGKRAWKSIWSGYRWNAKQRGHGWLLTRPQFERLIRLPCHYCGRPPRLARGNRAVNSKGLLEYYSGVDRLNHDDPYIYNRVVPCCAQCNYMKGDNSKREFLDHVRRISKFKDAA